MLGSIVGKEESGTFSSDASEFGISLEDDGRWQLVKRISASTAFARSPRLAHLLLYLCEQAILGHKHLLTEQNLAVAVFDRKANFDRAADTIVRSQMVRVRQRLEDYFREEGQLEQLRVSVPKGSYTPVFAEAPARALKVAEQPLAAPDATASNERQSNGSVSHAESLRTIWQLRIACIVLGALAVALGLVLLLARRPAHPMTGTHESATSRLFWGKLFDKSQKTTIVAADSGIVMLHGGTGQNSNLSEYLARNFSKELATVSEERQKELLADASRRYTSFVDLELIDRLSHLPEALAGSYNIRFARDITINDLKQGNIILSGSQDANPWIELFEPEMNFLLHDDLRHGVRGFFNRKPRRNELPLYTAGNEEFGILAFLPNLSGSGNVLIVEGTSAAGTEAISDFLNMDSDMEAFLRQIVKKDGSIPRFEILLRSQTLNGSASRSRIVAYRTY
jgi:hypothetical protein